MLVSAVLAPFVLAVFAPKIRRIAGPATGWLLAILPATLTVFFAQFLGSVSAGEPLRFSTPWVPALDIHLSFYVDGLSLMFALLISGIGFITAKAIVSREYSYIDVAIAMALVGFLATVAFARYIHRRAQSTGMEPNEQLDEATQAKVAAELQAGRSGPGGEA